MRVQKVQLFIAPPEGWDAVDAKTGAPVGIDTGWGYAPGESAASTANLVDLKVTAQVGRDEALARAYTAQLVADGAYQNWYSSIERQVTALAPKTNNMNAGDAVNFLSNSRDRGQRRSGDTRSRLARFTFSSGRCYLNGGSKSRPAKAEHLFANFPPKLAA